MSNKISPPKLLWSVDNPPEAVLNYFYCFNGEFDTSYIESGYPYSGAPSTKFRRNVLDKFDHYNHLREYDGDLWVPKRNDPLSDLAADLLAAASLLSEQKSEYSGSGKFPGGMHAESGQVCVPVLDGAVGVEVRIIEDEWTNKLSAYTRAGIRGEAAYKAIVELLGFSSPRLVRKK